MVFHYITATSNGSSPQASRTENSSGLLKNIIGFIPLPQIPDIYMLILQQLGFWTRQPDENKK